MYNRSVKSWLHDNMIEMYGTHNEGKSIVAQRVIRTLSNVISDLNCEKIVETFIERVAQDQTNRIQN